MAYHAAVLGDVGDQSSALIYGAGPIGIGLWFALRGMGLTEIDVIEPSETRRTSIEALGARTLDPTSQDVPALIADRTDGNGVDAAFHAAGVTPAVESALECIGERRPLVSVAIYDKPLPTPLINLVLRERRIRGRSATPPRTTGPSSTSWRGATTTPRAGWTPSPSAASSSRGSRNFAPVAQ